MNKPSLDGIVLSGDRDLSEDYLRDALALPLTGGTLTGGLEGTTAEVTDITTGNLLVTGALSITNMEITQAKVDTLFV